ncbi:TlpA family protein disulfide reductase [Flavihumibacter stibioxidans]|uniref:Thioredoxin domain-containing protein n=1 Tax=Flavihumibacter stibioxidans TaxID=1834163 RepID=A0ABR7MBQ5_9BACT|nr:hypothetical protein [Flavihumibacter stibioxidans]MBC6492468.1 hypothetical protein [Flavihumibacter stibioxidans]
MKTTSRIVFRLVPMIVFLAMLAPMVSKGQETAADKQSPTSVPPYLKFKTLPPFELRGINGQLIIRDQLPKSNGTIIMFFSPDCHHCVAQVDVMQKEIGKLQPFNLVMATYQPMENLVGFYNRYNLSAWKNLYIGRDEKYFMPPYFRIINLPYFALYNKKGEFVKVFEGNVAIDQLVSAFK